MIRSTLILLAVIVVVGTAIAVDVAIYSPDRPLSQRVALPIALFIVGVCAGMYTTLRYPGLRGWVASIPDRLKERWRS